MNKKNTNTKKIKLSKELCKDEIPYLLNSLNENIVDYDCSLLCKKYNNNVAYCCEASNAVPILFKAEYEYFKLHTDLWFKWSPKNKDDRELLEHVREDQIFAECKGVKYCNRQYRSITCRTFPLEPYIDLRGVFVGLTFLKDFLEEDENTITRCPLASRHTDIRQEFIDSHYLYWQHIMFRLKSEYDVYVYSSKKLREYTNKKKKELIILYPSWYEGVMSIREYIK